ncbi:MAG: VOC family protein [Aureispira sp.]
MRLNLLVIKTAHLEQLQAQYSLLGLSFVYHQHGNGPFHYACEQEDFVLELYPLPKHKKQADSTIRLGFEIANLATLLQQLRHSTWKILTPIQTKPWGNTAVLQDLDGRKIELKEVGG